MKKPKWMRAEKIVKKWEVEVEGLIDKKSLSDIFFELAEVKRLASFLGLKVKGDLKKSIAKGVILYER